MGIFTFQSAGRTHLYISASCVPGAAYLGALLTHILCGRVMTGKNTGSSWLGKHRRTSSFFQDADGVHGQKHTGVNGILFFIREADGGCPRVCMISYEWEEGMGYGTNRWKPGEIQAFTTLYLVVVAGSRRRRHQ